MGKCQSGLCKLSTHMKDLALEFYRGKESSRQSSSTHFFNEELNNLLKIIQDLSEDSGLKPALPTAHPGPFRFCADLFKEGQLGGTSIF